jgi:hypothetical protein
MALALASAVSGCEQQTGDKPAPFKPEYDGVQTRLLDDDLVSFQVKMKGARNNSDVDAYAECAAAQYALIRGYGFARHLRTNTAEEGGTWVCCLHHLASAPTRAENDRCRSHGFGLRREQDTDGVRT